MDKKNITNDKKIEIDQKLKLHRLISRMPEINREYGLWLINGSINHQCSAKRYSPDQERRFEFYSLSHLVSGHGKFYLDGIIQDVRPGDAILICPGDWNWYGTTNASDVYCEDSIRFYGRIPDSLRKAGYLRSSLVHIGEVRRIKQFLENHHAALPNDWMQSVIELQTLLYDLFVSPKRSSSPIETLLKTLRESPPNHWWTVADLAELRGTSDIKLRKEFEKYTGMLPKKYLEQFKLRQAAEMLLSTSNSVTETASSFGYVDRYHFSRRFKAYTGFSPEQYRKLFSPHPETNNTKS